jgi:hypothetical protein
MERKGTIVWDDPKNNKREAVASIYRLYYLRAIKDDKISPPPVAMLVGYKISEVSNGYAVFELNPEQFLNSTPKSIIIILLKLFMHDSNPIRVCINPPGVSGN